MKCRTGARQSGSQFGVKVRGKERKGRRSRLGKRHSHYRRIGFAATVLNHLVCNFSNDEAYVGGLYEALCLRRPPVPTRNLPSVGPMSESNIAVAVQVPTGTNLSAQAHKILAGRSRQKVRYVQSFNYQQQSRYV